MKILRALRDTIYQLLWGLLYVIAAIMAAAILGGITVGADWLFNHYPTVFGILMLCTVFGCLFLGNLIFSEEES